MTSFEEAARRVLSPCARLEPVMLRPGQAVGHVVAADVVKTVDVPPFDNSAMDGFAVRAADCRVDPVRLPVGGTVSAGMAPPDLVAGQAVRIMTGARLPAGADAVCPYERTTGHGDGGVTISGTVRAGDHVRRAGEDIVAGATVVGAGTTLTPVGVGVVESVGCDKVAVYRRPRVGVVSTGDELSGAAESGIYDSNRSMLTAALHVGGFDVEDLGTVGDDPALLLDLLAGTTVSRCDAVISTGGVSVGDHDVVRLALDRLPPGDRSWLRVAIKPAKPLAFALVSSGHRDRPLAFFGLPGNPVSAFVSFELFARPALRKMAGHARWWRPLWPARATEDLRRRPDGKTHLIMCRAEIGSSGRLELQPARRQGSHQLTSLMGANALALVADGDGVRAGAQAPAMLLDADEAAGADRARRCDDHALPGCPIRDWLHP